MIEMLRGLEYRLPHHFQVETLHSLNQGGAKKTRLETLHSLNQDGAKKCRLETHDPDDSQDKPFKIKEHRSVDPYKAVIVDPKGFQVGSVG
jgi:hypothetical protein